MAQGQLMFEVGIKQAVEGLDKVKKELDQFVTDYTKKMQIQVDIKNLETFINALKSIGNGEQLKPLLTQIERLQNRLASMTDKGQYFDMIRGEAEAAAAAVKIAEKNLENMKRTGNVNLISNARTNLEQAQQEAARTAAVLANATERFAKEEARAEATTNDTKKKIDALGDSVANLHTKIGSGININLSGDFSKWANEVNSVTTAVRELVEQLQKMNTTATTSSNVSNEALLAQAKTVEDLRNKLNGLYSEGMKMPKTEASYKAIEESKNVEQQLAQEQAKFNEMLTRGSSVAGSYAEAIQQLGQKYNLTAEQAQKLASIIANGNLERGNIQRGLGIGYERAGDIVETIKALQKLHQEENKPAPQNSIFDPQQFKTLQEAIDAVIREINRLKEAFAGIGEITGISKLTDAINTLYHNVNNFKDVFSTLSSAVNLTPTSEYVKKLQTDLEAAQKTIGELTEKMTALAAAQNNVAESASKAGKSEKQIGDSQVAMFNRYNKLLADIQNIEREALNLRSSLGGNNPFSDGLRDYIIALGRIRDEVKGITSAKDVPDAVAKGMSSEKLSKLSASLANIKTQYKEVVSDAKEFHKATDKGGSQAEARIRKLGMAFNELKNYMKVNGGSEEMKRLQQEIQGAIRKMRDLMNAGRYGDAINVYERLSGIIRQAATATKDFERAQHSVSSTVSHTNSQLMGQSQILSDLKTMAMQYLSVWGAKTFINNIIELGGQLEQQRLSIGAILGDMAAGQHLFDQIKALALTSPFGVMELDKDTKQLAAYGFKQSELFDMTKRLADISAGAGTQVSRLALALGHVRSEGALTGYTLRQFAMNNIPMLAKLSERLTELEGKIVSTAEIRKRVSKKEIGYEDVIAVIKDLTNEGGMFFNMQETMAEAVNAKFKNLKDSLDIMYGEMAEGKIGSGMKRLAESLMYLTRNWEDTMRVMGYAAAAFLSYKVAMAGANTQMLTFGRETLTTKMALDAKKIALTLNSASVKKLTADEIDQMVALKLVTREQLLNAVATKKLTVDQAELAAATFGVNRAELVSIATKGKLGLVTAGLGLRMRSLILSIRGVGAALKSMLLNPVGIALMAITAGFEVFMRWRQHNQEISESIDKMQKKGSEGYANLSDSVNKFMSLNGKLSESELKAAIDDITDSLKNYAPDANNILKQAQDIDDLGKRYEYLREQLILTKKAYADLQLVASTAVNANEESGLGNEVEDYIKDLKDVQKAEQDFYQHRAAIEKVLSYMDGYAGFKKARRNDDGSLKSVAEQIKLIRSNEGWSSTFSTQLYSASQAASKAWNNLLGELTASEQRMKDEVAPAITDFADRINNDFSAKFGNNWKESGDHVKAAWMEVVEEIGKVPGMTDDVKNQLLDEIFNKRWHMNIDFSTGEVTEKLTGWRKEVQDWLDENKLGIKIGFNDSHEDFIKKVKTLHDSAQTAMDNSGKVLIGVGFKLDNLPSELPSPLATPWNQSNLETYNEQKNTLDLIEELKKKFNVSWKEKGTKGSGSGSHEDKDAKDLRERMRILKEAADSYKYWRDKVGEGGAEAHVNEEFGEVLKKMGYQFKDVQQLRETIQKEIKRYQEIYDKSGKKRPQLLEAIKEGYKTDAGLNRNDFEKDTERFLSKTQIELDNLTRSWETFNSVREATGNVKLAIDLSGAQYAEGQTRNLADAIKQKLESDFKSAGAAEIPFDINLSEEQIGDTIKAAIPKAREDQIEGLVEDYKKWRDLQRDVLRQDIDMFAKLVGGAKDYDTQIQLINKSLQLQIEANEQLVKKGVISRSDADKANNAANAQADYDKWKLTYQYSQLMNNSLALTRQELEDGIVVATEKLNQLMQANGISAKEYADEMMKITNLQKEWKSNALFGSNGRFAAGAKGGLSGLSAYYRRNQQKAAEEYARLRQKGASQEELRDVQNKYNKNERAAKKVEGLENVLSSMDALAKAMEPVVDLFDKLGMSDLGDILGAGTNAIQSASSMASGAVALFGESAGPYGAAIGAGLSIASSIFAMHDAAIQEEIDALKSNVDALEANTAVIKALRERTLGYDTGTLRKALSGEYSQYNGTINTPWKDFTYNTKYGAAGVAMADYYARNGNGTGYMQEYENLKNMRQDYIDMYNLEKEKKESSEEALLDYKKQIAELDEQILFFVEDLANDLYSIDFKAWADQISDALWTAFENGEDALDAFHDTAKDIIADVAKRMMNIKLIEPMFSKLEDELFGTIDDNGNRINGKAYNYETGQFNEEETLRILGQFFGEDGEFAKVVTSAEDFYKMAEQVTGFNFGSGGSTSKKLIQGGFTESETGLLLSYVNGMRADLSINRSMIAQYFPMYYAAMTSGNSSLQNIDRNTAAIMRSNETIVGKITSLDDNIRGLKNNMWRVPTA